MHKQRTLNERVAAERAGVRDLVAEAARVARDINSNLGAEDPQMDAKIEVGLFYESSLSYSIKAIFLVLKRFKCFFNLLTILIGNLLDLQILTNRINSVCIKACGLNLISFIYCIF